MAAVTIYVYLLNEGVDVWRAVQATRLSEEVFQINPSVVVPDGEQWRFQPGQQVRCRWRSFADGEGLEAFEVAV